MAPHEFSGPIRDVRGTGGDRLVLEVPQDVAGEFVGGFVAAGAILLEAAHHDPVKVAPQQGDQLGRCNLAVVRGGAEHLALQGLEAVGRADRLVFADVPARFIEPDLEQVHRVERSPAGEQFVEEDAERVDIGTRIHIDGAQLGLFRADVGRGPDELSDGREGRLRGEVALGRLGDAEVDHLGHGDIVVQGDENVRGLDVAVDDALEVRVLDRMADLDEKAQALVGRQIVRVAKGRDRLPADQFHDEIRPTGVGGAGVEHLRDIRMIHHRQELPFGLEPGDDLLCVHAQFDDFEREAAAHGVFLPREPDGAAAAFPDIFEELVATDLVAGLLRGETGRTPARIDGSRDQPARQQGLDAVDEGVRGFAVRQMGPVDRSEFGGHVRLGVVGCVDHDGQQEGARGRHRQRPLRGQIPLDPKIPLQPRLGVRRNHRHEEGAGADLVPDLCVPGIAADEGVPIKPDLDAGRAQGIGDAPRRHGVLVGVTQEYRRGKVRFHRTRTKNPFEIT